MESLIDRYYDAIDSLYKKIRTTQKDAMHKAAEAIANCLANGGQVHIYDSGHIINSELLSRAGGPAFLKRFNYSFSVDANKRPRETSSKLPLEQGAATRLAFATSGVREGDVFILGSVSGKSENIIDIGLCAKEAGCTLIAVTSVAYSEGLKSAHPSGKRLFEIGDILLDNCAPEGDAMLEVEGMEHKCFPASGLGAAYMLWAVMADTTEIMIEKGLYPSVYKSVNYPDGPEGVKKTDERYAELGY